jgi:FkbM family methyltransferase
MTNVTFFDLGAYDGADSVRFVENMAGLDVNPVVHMIEANTLLAHRLPLSIYGVRTNYWNFAVSLKRGLHPFYVAQCDEGSSIYETKEHLTGEKQYVEHTPLTQWLRMNGLSPKPENDIWILKANIEGAEWDLICDLEETNAWGWFDICCGPAFVAADMGKVRELERLRHRAYSLVRNRLQNVYPFAVPTDNFPREDQSVDLGPLVQEIIDARELLCPTGL